MEPQRNVPRARRLVIVLVAQGMSSKVTKPSATHMTSLFVAFGFFFPPFLLPNYHRNAALYEGFTTYRAPPPPRTRAFSSGLGRERGRGRGSKRERLRTAMVPRYIAAGRRRSLTCECLWEREGEAPSWLRRFESLFIYAVALLLLLPRSVDSKKLITNLSIHISKRKKVRSYTCPSETLSQFRHAIQRVVYSPLEVQTSCWSNFGFLFIFSEMRLCIEIY